MGDDKVKVLIIADEVWNDQIHGNNVLTNWFKGFDAEFAQIFCSPGLPKNNVCSSYFQITDKMMFKSILTLYRAGNRFFLYDLDSDKNIKDITFCEPENIKLYRFLKNISGDFLRIIRQIIWCLGRYDKNKLNKFLLDEKPDIIFAPRYSTLKLLRLEKYVTDYLNVPIIAFTGDDEYSLSQIKISPFYWGYKLMLRNKMRKQIPRYSLYYTHSLIQGNIYNKVFGIETKQLLKSGDFKKNNIHTKVNDVIKIVYIGKLYCNRWKTLSIVVDSLKFINQERVKAILEIYTLDKITKKQSDLLNDKKNSFIMGGINPDKIEEVYRCSDIVLHVESFSLKYKLLTKYSFSTKVVDSLASGCALWAIGWKNHCACLYLKNNDCAIVSTSNIEIKSDLIKMIENRQMILDYANKAYEFGKNNLQKEIIQNIMKSDFYRIINQYNRD